MMDGASQQTAALAAHMETVIGSDACGHNGSLTVQQCGLAVKMISCRKPALPDEKKALTQLNGCVRMW
jgi:hypothetical protein